MWLVLCGYKLLLNCLKTVSLIAKDITRFHIITRFVGLNKPALFPVSSSLKATLNLVIVWFTEMTNKNILLPDLGLTGKSDLTLSAISTPEFVDGRSVRWWRFASWYGYLINYKPYQEANRQQIFIAERVRFSPPKPPQGGSRSSKIGFGRSTASCLRFGVSWLRNNK